MKRVLTVFAAAFLLAACETTSQDYAATDADADARAGSSAGAGDGTDTAVGGVDQEGLDSEQRRGPEAGTQEHLDVEVGDRVFFEFDSSSLTSDAQQTVEALAAWMRAHPRVALTIEGHADERGTREYNIALGARRANSVRDFLITLGIDSNRVETVSYGEERPAVLGSNEDAWAQNRRAVFVVDEDLAGV